MQDTFDRQHQTLQRAHCRFDESEATVSPDNPAPGRRRGDGPVVDSGGAGPRKRRQGRKITSAHKAAGARELRATTEVFLSYLTGLGPVGEPIEPRLAWAMEDLGYRQKVSIYRCLSDLIACGCVRKIAPGSSGTIGLIVVDVRLEDIARARRAEREDEDDGACEAEPIGAGRVRAGRATPRDWAARIAEIPEDTRSLTARTFGDPIPGDQRRLRPSLRRLRAVSLHLTARAEERPPFATPAPISEWRAGRALRGRVRPASTTHGGELC